MYANIKGAVQPVRLTGEYDSYILATCFSEIQSECQTVCIKIRFYILSGLNGVQTVCKDYQPITVADKEFKICLFLSNSLDLDQA